MRSIRQGLTVALACLAFGSGASRAAVVDSSEAGFTLTFEAKAKATPMKSYRAVVNSIGKWWSSEHTYTGDAAHLYIEDRPGGCFCERFPVGGGIEHMRVLYSDPGRALRLSGALGPLQEMAITGRMTWNFAQVEEGTEIRLTYAVGGYGPGGLAPLAGIVDRVISEQFARFVRFVETGYPVARE
jgi:hypothetical protein